VLLGHAPAVVNGRLHHLRLRERLIRLRRQVGKLASWQVGNTGQRTSALVTRHRVALHVVQLIGFRVPAMPSSAMKLGIAFKVNSTDVTSALRV
jgi:hypothetical protein